MYCTNLYPRRLLHRLPEGREFRACLSADRFGEKIVIVILDAGRGRRAESKGQRVQTR